MVRYSFRLAECIVTLYLFFDFFEGPSDAQSDVQKQPWPELRMNLIERESPFLQFSLS